MNPLVEIVLTILIAVVLLYWCGTTLILQFYFMHDNVEEPFHVQISEGLRVLPISMALALILILFAPEKL